MYKAGRRFKIVEILKFWNFERVTRLENPLREPHYGSLFRSQDVTDSNVVSYEGCDDTNHSSCLRDTIGRDIDKGGKKKEIS